MQFVLNLLKMSLTRLNMLPLIALMSVGSVIAQDNEEVLYGDCGYIQFTDVSDEELTEEEKLRKLDNDFEDALSRSEKCLKTAIDSSNKKLAQAAGAGGSTGGGTGNNAPIVTEEGTDKENQSPNPNTSKDTRSAPSAPHQTGKPTTGASAVCEAVIQGLNSATTDNEKQHFEKLVEQYKCNVKE